MMLSAAALLPSLDTSASSSSSSSSWQLLPELNDEDARMLEDTVGGESVLQELLADWPLAGLEAIVPASFNDVGADVDVDVDLTVDAASTCTPTSFSESSDSPQPIADWESTVEQSVVIIDDDLCQRGRTGSSSSSSSSSKQKPREGGRVNKKREANREAAYRYRLKQKLSLDVLEEQRSALEVECRDLEASVASTESELQFLLQMCRRVYRSRRQTAAA